MQPRPEPAATIHRRRERDGLPVNDRRLRQELDAGRFVRIAPGSFVPRESWRALSRIDRHHLSVVEALERTRGPVVVSHHAAAAVWGIDMIGAWPDQIDTVVAGRGGGRSSGRFRRRAIGADDTETVSWRGHELTTPAQTALDLARIGSGTAGVVALDQALWARRDGGALTTADEVHALLDRNAPRRGDARTARALDFATELSDSVRESHSRVLMHRLGFPPPVLQQEFVLPGGKIARTDFWWEEGRQVGEFDGVGKYIDPALRAGRSAEQVLIDEKDRGDALRRMVRAVSRWRTPDLRDPRRLWDILTNDGLRSTRPRPPRGLLWY
jgi:hypothetical protein